MLEGELRRKRVENQGWKAEHTRNMTALIINSKQVKACSEPCKATRQKMKAGRRNKKEHAGWKQAC